MATLQVHAVHMCSLRMDAAATIPRTHRHLAAARCRPASDTSSTPQASTGLASSPRTHLFLDASPNIYHSDEGESSSPDLTRRSLVLSSTSLACWLVFSQNNYALADVKISLSNVRATEVPCPEGQTTVTGRTSFGATCFRVTGDAFNPSNRPVYNADVFGRVYDAQGEPALDAAENLRIDTIAEIPPGKSKVSFQITVNAAQANLGPLELKNFKATGFLGKVNSKQGSGRLDDIDFSELDRLDEIP